MLKILLETLSLKAIAAAGDQAMRDPLAHPDLARMDQRALADLQFRPECVAPD
jgi:hypothetical protein